MNSGRKILLAAFFAVLLAAIAPAAFAHHGEASYDTTKLVTVKGAVTEFSFRNPHVQILMAVKNDSGSVENWRGELNSPNIVARITGWTGKTFRPGDELMLVGNRAKNGLNVLKVEKILRPDGTEIFPKDGNGVTKY
jgi:hypothetical protein